jgi:hypothetical protein
VPLTTLWPTFLAVCTVLFATFFAVLTGPASIVPMEMATARIIDKNAFIVLIDSFLKARMRLPDGRHVAVPNPSGLGPPGFEPGTKGL